MLLDTSTLLWYAINDPRLSPKAKRIIAKGGCFLSIASVWEIAIKAGIGKLHLVMDGHPVSAEEFSTRTIRLLKLRLLPLELEDATAVEILEPHHKDPFDRLLVAQSSNHGLPIVSADTIFDRYRVKRIWK